MPDEVVVPAPEPSLLVVVPACCIVSVVPELVAPAMAVAVNRRRLALPGEGELNLSAAEVPVGDRRGSVTVVATGP